MRKLLALLLLISTYSYGQTNNSTNTKFTNGLQAPNGTPPKPTSGLTAGAMNYTTSVGFQVYDGTSWVTLGVSGSDVTSFTGGFGLTPTGLQTGAVTSRVDSTTVQTVANFFPKGDTRWAKTSQLYWQKSGTTISPLTAGDILSIPVGTLANGTKALTVTATQPSSPVALQQGILFDITSAGSSAQPNAATWINYNAGYTGAAGTYGQLVSNSVLGTAGTLIPAAGIGAPGGNSGILGRSLGTTTGYNFGIIGFAEGGSVNSGLIGLAQNAKNGATNIGVTGTAINTGSSPVQIGGYFSLNQTTLQTVSGALVADNGSQTSDILRVQDNGSSVFKIADGGVWSLGASTGTSGQVITSNGSGSAPTWQDAPDLSGYLPLTAGNTKHLTGTLYGDAGVTITGGSSYITAGNTGANLGLAADAGLDLTGGTYINIGSPNVYLNNLPPTSASGYSLLTRNTSSGKIEVVNYTGLGTVTSVSGTTNRISVTNPATTPVIDISSSYVGQSSITTVGALSSGSLTTGFTPVTNALLANSSLTIGSTNIALGSTSTTLSGLSSVASTAFVGALTGNSSTATVLATARTIGTLTGDVTSAGSSFNGSADNTNSTTVTRINGTSLAGLATGILKNTTSTGVPSIAVSGDFPTLNQNTTGSAATLTTTRTLWGQNFNGSGNVNGTITSTVAIGAVTTTNSGGTGSLFHQVTNTGNNSYFGTESSAGSSIFSGSSIYATVLGNASARATEFATNSNIRYSISSTGNHDFKSGTGTFGGKVGIGTASGTANLAVASSANNNVLRVESTDASTYADILAYFKSARSTSGHYLIYAENSTGEQFSIRGDGQIKTALGTGAVQSTAGVLSVISSGKFKDWDYTRKVPSALNLIDGIESPNYYHWNEKSGLPKEVGLFGLNADNVHAVLGEEFAPTQPIQVGDNTPTYGLQDRAIMSLMLQAIKELKKEVDTLKSQK